MQRFCFTFTLRPGAEAEYQRRHDEIWPEMVQALQQAGIRNYSLFRRGLDVIAYAHTAFAKIAATEVDARWSEWFTELIERRFGDDGAPMTAQEVWHLD
jgi:L-rhamnose mutarotase